MPSAPILELTAPMDDLKARIRHNYTVLAPVFEAWMPSADFRETFRRSVLEEVRNRKAGQRIRILEIGCGHGTWATEIFDQIDDGDRRIDYLGIDLTEPRIDTARRRFAGRPAARFEVADAEQFEPSEAVDLILAIEVLSHVPFKRYPAWLAQWKKWLLPGGSAVIIDKERYSTHNLRLKWDTFKDRWLPTRVRGRPYYFGEGFSEYVRTLDYPSFGRLIRTARRVGLSTRPLFKHGVFRALAIDRST